MRAAVPPQICLRRIDGPPNGQCTIINQTEADSERPSLHHGGGQDQCMACPLMNYVGAICQVKRARVRYDVVRRSAIQQVAQRLCVNIQTKKYYTTIGAETFSNAPNDQIPKGNIPAQSGAM